MSSFLHFSHEHPLIFNQEKSIDREINRDHVCHICSLPILLSSSYSCSVIGCKYFLHEPCALLPQRKHLPWDFLSSREFNLIEHEGQCNCTVCQKPCEKLHYSYRTQHVHPMCAAKMEIKTKHKSHPLHPLVAACRDMTARCDACGKKQDGYFFSCQPCDFWLHVDCALLPRFAECTDHKHHLILSYSIHHYAVLSTSFILDAYEYFRCIICSGDLTGSGAYLCGDCRRFAHLSCVAEKMVSEAKSQVEITYLPFDDLDALWSRMIQNLQKLMLDKGRPAYDHNLLHDHGLILYNEDDDHGNVEPYTSQELVCCNTCIQPIYPPFYACPQSQTDGCHFHLHQQCSQLPSKFRNRLVYYFALDLRTWSTKASLCSLFHCFCCRLPGNGLSYCIDTSNTIDITCLSALKFVQHDSHSQHILYHFKFKMDDRGRILRCCAASGSQYAYFCVDCDFAIHVHCAMLPKHVKHKFDIHPLKLITTGIIKGASDYYLCEFCEENIDSRFWYYGCEECDNLFHIKCIPSVGYLSRVKFGSSITVPCHPHRVTFVRMLGYGSQECGYCMKSIQGFVDDMAFHCSKCDFWMHFGCAENCTGAQKFEKTEEYLLVLAKQLEFWSNPRRFFLSD